LQPGQRAAVAPAAAPQKVHGVPHLEMPKDDLSSLEMVDEPAASESTAPSKIMAFGVKALATDKAYKRNAPMTGRGAMHVKTFHGILNDDGMERLDARVNDWVEAHPNVEIKFATTTIGIWDGKTKDQSLIINVWY
jgi:hypothetical protein